MIVEQALCYGYTDVRELPVAGMCCINRFMFTHAILSGLDDFGYHDRWCYETYQEAKRALEQWSGEGEPDGWIRHPTSGRRREAGKKDTEWVAP